MRSTFASIEIGRSALLAHRHAIDVTGHNIANANTPGYSRQVARLVTTRPYATPSLHQSTLPGQIGTGVQVQEIVRMHDSFVQFQINSELQTQGYWQKREQILGEIEATFLEPSEAGIRHAVDLFWQALQGLSNDPEEDGTRAVVRERAIVLTEAIQSAYRQFKPMQAHLESQIRANVSEINGIIDQVTALNREIKAVIVAGNTPNDLFDTRDQLIERLATLVDIQVVEQPHGQISVSLGGVNMIDGVSSRHIDMTPDEQTGFVQLTWSNTNIPVTIRSGELKALFEGRDVEIPYYMEQLNDFARTLITEINRIHKEGYGYFDTFDPNDYPDPATRPSPPGRLFFNDASVDAIYMDEAAAHISLSDDILADAANIAASRNGTIGDGTNALYMAQIKDTRVFGDKTDTPGGFLGGLVSGVGVKTQQAQTMVLHQEVMLGHLERLRGSVSGVSLDEEMTNLIMFQHGYGAASRFITAIDEMVETIIGRMGIVGR